ncbi:MAG: P-type conjugative transfer protein TrbJ [Hyphomonadaceae bacterium]
MTLRSLRRAALAAVLAVSVPLAAMPPASAQMAVIDPTNLIQNVLTAARALEQISNQITQIQQQAESLINEARNLTSLPLSTLSTLQAQVQRTQQLLAQAQRIAFSVEAIERQFAEQYSAIDMSASDRALADGAMSRWRNSVAAFEDSLRVQAGVVSNLDGARDTMDQLVGASQSATGALQAAQAGNQLLALQSQQIADLTALMAAQARAESLESARQAAAQAQAREQMRRFLERPNGYQPGDARMFND